MSLTILRYKLKITSVLTNFDNHILSKQLMNDFFNSRIKAFVKLSWFFQSTCNDFFNALIKAFVTL